MRPTAARRKMTSSRRKRSTSMATSWIRCSPVGVLPRETSYLARGCAKVVPWRAREASVIFDGKMRSDSDDIRYSDQSHSPGVDVRTAARCIESDAMAYLN